MEIPENTVSEQNLVDKAIAYVLSEFAKGKGEVHLGWTEWKQWVAHETARRFIEKGYHATTTEHMRGNGPNWFWYGVRIAKYRLEAHSLPKSVGRVLG